MYKVAVMGDRDSIYGFAAVGLTPFFVNDGDDVGTLLKTIVESNEYAILYITEKAAANIEKEIKYYSNRRLPSIILIPGISGNTGRGIKAVKESVERAVGSDIIFGD
ncbi:MAG: V-type ATP synthase subunit F [Lachnospiraceae bacterium]|nr:V-type ATP synthase subunit F [Lachnospiraceae bacterium]